MKFAKFIVLYFLSITSYANQDLIDKSFEFYNQGKYSKTYETLLPLADSGNPRAQYLLGSLYENGKGVLKDMDRAIDLYKKSAASGYSGAQNSLGVFYEMGIGVLQDYKESFFWYKKAADQGHPQAIMNVGFLYLDGLGVNTDKKAAANYLKRAYEHPELPKTTKKVISDTWSSNELWKY